MRARLSEKSPRGPDDLPNEPSRTQVWHRLRENIRSLGGSSPRRRTFRTIVWRMVEEELRHRGELNALFWQQDVGALTRAWFGSALAD